jgi:hypothetical protein
MHNPYQYNRSSCSAYGIPPGGKKVSFKIAASITRLVSLLTVFFITVSSQAQQASDYAVHANILYRFTKYIDWPEEKKSGDFIIAVLGDTPLYEELKTSMINKKVGNQKIIIKKFSGGATDFNCHILFISEDESSNIRKISSKTAGASVLLVSESEGLAQKGSCINFVIAADRLKLEINKANVEARQLGIASELLQLGKIVK